MDGHKRLNYYRQSPDDVIAEVQGSRHGLSAAEAEHRLSEFGLNTLQQTHHDWPLVIFLRQFKSLFVVILLVAAGFSLYLRDYKTATILIAIALMNAAVGYFQEHKAEALLRSLEMLLVPKAKVIRETALSEVDSSKLVIGDLVYIEEGDSVPADLRIIDEEELATNDFALTGESSPSRKFVHAISDDVPLGNRHNLVFMGTTVAIGHGHGIVIGTGMHTELGRIASLSQSTKTDASPLQKEMNNLATRLTQGTILLAILLLVITLQFHWAAKDALLFAISIAAAMIPNGLVAEVNITLAQSASRLARMKALVKKLSAVETLGATTIICTDKTGTLTKNEMSVTKLLIGRTDYGVAGTGYEPKGWITDSKGKPLTKKRLKDTAMFFKAAAMASNARVDAPDSEHRTWYVVGDPTEGALITMSRKAGVDPDALDGQYEELKEFQFDSARKLMSSVRRYDDQLVVFVKGSPEALLERSTHISDHGHLRKLQAADYKFLLDHHQTNAEAAMRNLAVGYRVLPASTNLKKLVMNEVESNLTFLGIASMVDPLREQVPAAMRAAQEANIRVSVVTGDFPVTAKAIATQANLAVNAEDITVVLGEELPKLADSQILQLVEHGGVVFSRVAPEDKLRIVDIAKHSGHVVAVTGDGINDAPALKRADIGVAMGKTGTDVAKNAAEIVLLDDSFSTLVRAIEQGRLTFQNIKKAARCALTDNAGELILILISLLMSSIFHIPIAITAIQILAIDVIAEMFPISALGWDKAQRNLMRGPARKLSDHIINRPAVMEFVGFGLLSALIAYGNYLFFFARAGLSPAYVDNHSTLYMQASILTYVTIVLCQFINLLLVRTDDKSKFFTDYLWSNKRLLVAFGFSFFCIFNIIYNPVIQPFFSARPLTWVDWLTALVCAAVYLGVRLLHRHSQKHTRHAVIKLHREVHGHNSPARV